MKVVEVDTLLFLFQITERKLSVFHNLALSQLCVSYCGSYYLSYDSSILIMKWHEIFIMKFLSWSDMKFCQHLLRYGFAPHSVDIMYHIYQFSHVSHPCIPGMNSNWLWDVICC
jgi:hypothetical protein